MKAPDLDRERSERKLPLSVFLSIYNEGLPKGFPRASRAFLEKYKKSYPFQFENGQWSLDLHRKKFMDWLSIHLKSFGPG